MKDYGAESLPMNAPDLAEDYGGEGGGSTADKGYKCEQKFPLSGGFWTQPPRGGEA